MPMKKDGSNFVRQVARRDNGGAESGEEDGVKRRNIDEEAKSCVHAGIFAIFTAI